MTRISYLNGEFLPHEQCLVHIEDRGFQFADGAYEVNLFTNGKLIDGAAHSARMLRSLGELNIEHDFDTEKLQKIQLELFSKNPEIKSGTCYIQITRGATNRAPSCPKGLKTTISATVSPLKSISAEEFAHGFNVMTTEDIRWLRCDIKTVNLLASTLTNQKAKDLGFDDAIFVRDGIVTEATYANVFIIDANENLITHPADNHILCGITRNRLLDLAQKNGIKVIEKKFSVAEMYAAKEVFLSSSSLIIRPVRKINEVLLPQEKSLNFKIAPFLSEKYQEFVKKYGMRADSSKLKACL